MPDVTLLDFGLAGIMAGITLKALDLAIVTIKDKLENGGAHKPKQEASPKPERRNDQAASGFYQDANAKLDEILRRVARLEKVVIDGNGREPLTTQIAVIKSDLKNHIQDKGLHLSEK